MGIKLLSTGFLLCSFFVQAADGSFERRAVELGRADDRRVEVVRGLQAGERVAVAGAGALQTAYAAVE